MGTRLAGVFCVARCARAGAFDTAAPAMMLQRACRSGAAATRRQLLRASATTAKVARRGFARRAAGGGGGDSEVSFVDGLLADEGYADGELVEEFDDLVEGAGSTGVLPEDTGLGRGYDEDGGGAYGDEPGAPMKESFILEDYRHTFDLMGAKRKRRSPFDEWDFGDGVNVGEVLIDTFDKRQDDIGVMDDVGGMAPTPDEWLKKFHSSNEVRLLPHAHREVRHCCR